MLLDVRLPIGLLFVAIGVLVAVQGLLSPAVVTGLDIDLIWGAAMAGFGALMLGLALMARRRRN
jgi:LPXTG-motif cell wall-anchored protein